MPSAKTQRRNRFMRIITTPMRAFGKAKDFYVRSMKSAGKMGYGGSAGVPVGQFSALPKSFSARPTRTSDSAAEDYAELVRAASARSYGTRIDVDAILRQEQRQSAAAIGGAKGLPKCSSVGMGKIDEDKACCDFGEDVVHRPDSSSSLFPRSRSYAVAKRRIVY